MKLNVKYMIAAFALLGLVGCDKNFEEFETSGGGSPAAVELSTVVSEALPGQFFSNGFSLRLKLITGKLQEEKTENDVFVFCRLN